MVEVIKLIPQECKIKLTELYIQGNLQELSRELRKLLNEDYTDILDVHYIYKNLTIIYKKLGNFDISKYYLKQAMNNIDTPAIYASEYYELEWLYVGLYKESLTKKDKLHRYLGMHRYYESMGQKRNTYCLQCDICALQDDIPGLFKVLYTVCSEPPFLQKDDTIKEILNDVKSLGTTYYSEALSIVQNYDYNAICRA